MSDISKCSGINESDIACPLRKTCWRYLAPENDKWQSWIAAPFKIDKISYSEEGASCDSYWISDADFIKVFTSLPAGAQLYVAIDKGSNPVFHGPDTETEEKNE